MMISVITPTHDPQWLAEAANSLLAQTHQRWQWVILPNGPIEGRPDRNDILKELSDKVQSDDRVTVLEWAGRDDSHMRRGNIGAIKRRAFGHGFGDVLLELDHDDILEPNALTEIAHAFEDPTIDFVYSDCIDFSIAGELVTYHEPARRAAWEREGWRFSQTEAGVDYPLTWEPGALALSRIMYAPNHLRAWRRSFYKNIGGHNPEYDVCDDHELLIRTYLYGRMKRIPKPLYRYRVSVYNSWLSQIQHIQAKTVELSNQHLPALIMRECELRGGPMIDLGGGIDSPGWPWVAADIHDSPSIDLTGRWPWEDSSVTAFRAHDILEHLPDKMHTMSEIYRCLKPGGWLLSATPSATGQGAFQDPTHCSYWVENSFRYYTETRFARYIRNDTERFMAARLFTTQGDIPYVIADLVSLKDDRKSFPGERRI